MKKTLALVVLALVAATVSAQARREIKEEEYGRTYVTVELLPEDRISISFSLEFNSEYSCFTGSSHVRIELAGEQEVVEGDAFVEIKEVAQDLTPTAILFKEEGGVRKPYMIYFHKIDYGTQGADKK